MRQLPLLLKRHASSWFVTFFLVSALSFFSSQALCGENDTLQDLLNTMESSVNGERLVELIEELRKNKIVLNEAIASAR